ncbi:protein ALP1-like [Ananas comosus]|uniref:Protein ALP1-like n=1 Tax=Ananas comosus TaxID=4615 RepID=A0A6P5GMT3_ANACO|nr:protein ALP1-like [Ananas comosus]
MQFIYTLPRLEGSAADSRVLQDAISRLNGLKVPQGYFYLCDSGYPNGEGFLTPYRGQHYHLSEGRQARQPQTLQELYNYKHSSARNVIERCFGLLKERWAILRGKSYYPTKVACRIISVCALLHNHIRREMPVDPLE